MGSKRKGYFFKRGSTWSARVTIGGKRRTKGGFLTKAHAELWASEQYRQAEKAQILGIDPVRDDVTLKTILSRWLSASKRKIAASTLESYQSIAETRLIPWFEDTPLVEIKKPEIDEFLAAKSEEGKANGTLNRYLSVLSRIFAFAKDAGIVRSNPCREVKRARETPTVFTYLSPEDEARLLTAMPDWLRTPALVALDAGLRSGEIGNLKPRDVDLGRGVLVVRKSKSQKPREVGMTQRLKDVLHRHMRSLPKGSDWAFLTPEGKAFEKGRYRYALLNATKAADLEGFRFHDLRHSCGARLAEAGATPATIKAVLGHKSLAATMRYMDHAPLDAARTAALLLDARRIASSEEAGRGAVS